MKSLPAVVFFALLASSPASAQTDPDPNATEHATGLLIPTATERAWLDTHCKKILRVRLNPIGLERANAHRRSLALHDLPESPVEVADFGQEFVTEETPPDGPGTRDSRTQAAPHGMIPGSPLPSACDNSQLKYFPRIGKQGAQNSCSSFSTVYYQATHNTALLRDWDAKDGGNKYRFSPKWTYNMLGAI